MDCGIIFELMNRKTASRNKPEAVFYESVFYKITIAKDS